MAKNDNFFKQKEIELQEKHGAMKGDESATHKGEKDYTTKKGDELKHSGKGRGEKKGDKAYINEEEVVQEESENDSDEEETSWDDDEDPWS